MTPTPHGPAERADLVASVVRRLDDCRPSDVADLAIEELTRVLGARDVVVYLATLEETELHGVVTRHSPRRPSASVDGTAVGDSYVTASATVDPGPGAGDLTIRAPVSHGRYRLGVLELTTSPASEAEEHAHVETAIEVGRLIAQALLTKSHFGDGLQQARRSQEMALGAELLESLLPPPVHATEEVVVAALLEPGYSTGGDAYDYAVNEDTAHFAVLDAMGHGFAAALTSTVAITAYRNSRRAGLALVETYQAMESAVASFAEGGRFVTAILAELDTTTGRLTWISAGHPPPLLVRAALVGDTLDADPLPPLGTELGLGLPTVSEEYLEPGDVLIFYTDGLTEARDLDSALLGVDGLVDLVQRSTASQRSLPELVRSIRTQLGARADAWVSDDATALCVEWLGSSALGADVP
ncbi:PP2C family protein-serine/threonine phosphatase [soil metagenome]